MKTEKYIDLKRMETLMKEQKVDILVGVSPENVLYSSSAHISTQKTIRERLAMSVFTLSDNPTLIICGIEEILVRDETWIEDIRTYVEFEESPIEKLVEVIKENNLENGTVAIEKKYLSQYYYEELVKSLPNTTFVQSEPIFDRLRVIKSPEEIRKLRRAAEITHQVYEEVFSQVKPGITEREFANKLKNRILEKGANDIQSLRLSTGSRSKIIHSTPEDVPLKNGDVVKLDFVALFDGYYSDVARTIIIGEGSERKHHVLSSLAEIHKKVINNARPGVKCSYLYNLCKDLFEAKNIPLSMPHIGHSMGVGLHENPTINPHNDTELEENMIINIEPVCIDQESNSGYHLEDLILIKEDGPEILTGSTLHEHPIIINNESATI